MPRILPRLKGNLDDTFRPSVAAQISSKWRQLRRRRRPQSLYRPLPHLPQLKGRTASILLEEDSPVAGRYSNRFVYHKKLPPVVSLPVKDKFDEKTELVDPPREMTEEEKTWYGSPWLRMLSSPMRQCVLTKKYAPSDFLIRIASLRLRSQTDLTGRTKPAEVYVLPDGILHPRYSHRASGLGKYILCRKGLASFLQDPRISSRLRLSPFARIHALLGEQIGWQLRQRVIQEIELLTERIRCAPRGNVVQEHRPAITRRLTRAEWDIFMNESGKIPSNSFPNAMAVLIVPPVRNYDASPSGPVLPGTASNQDTLNEKRTPFPIMRLIDRSMDVSMDNHGLVPNESIPLFNGAVLFPNKEHRMQLFRSLTALLGAEGRARYTTKGVSSGQGNANEVPQKVANLDRHSHAFLLTCSPQTVKVADAVPLAVALWRVRMWEEGGLSHTGLTSDGWSYVL